MWSSGRGIDEEKLNVCSAVRTRANSIRGINPGAALRDRPRFSALRGSPFRDQRTGGVPSTLGIRCPAVRGNRLGDRRNRCAVVPVATPSILGNAYDEQVLDMSESSGPSVQRLFAALALR
jgi:hypothetical protein